MQTRWEYLDCLKEVCVCVSKHECVYKREREGERERERERGKERHEEVANSDRKSERVMV